MQRGNWRIEWRRPSLAARHARMTAAPRHKSTYIHIDAIHGARFGSSAELAEALGGAKLAPALPSPLCPAFTSGLVWQFSNSLQLHGTLSQMSIAAALKFSLPTKAISSFYTSTKPARLAVVRRRRKGRTKTYPRELTIILRWIHFQFELECVALSESDSASR